MVKCKQNLWKAVIIRIIKNADFQNKVETCIHEIIVIFSKRKSGSKLVN